MKFIYKLLLAISATLWMVIVYGIKADWRICFFPPWGTAVVLLLIPLCFSRGTICLTHGLKPETPTLLRDIEEVNSIFLPVYLGYFFVGLSVNKWQHMLFIYGLICFFTYKVQAQYFNPSYLLFGYRFYRAKTGEGKRIFLITYQNLDKKIEEKFDHLKRINDTTFIETKEKNK